MSVARSKGRGISVTNILLQLLPAAFLVAVFSAVGVMHVMGRVEVVDSGYRLSQLEGQNRALTLENDRLKLELATLKSPARLERVARQQLGMAPPTAGAVLSVTSSLRQARHAPLEPSARTAPAGVRLAERGE